MTRKEAINMLKSKMDGHTDTSYEWAETVRMAIKALEQEQSEDTISRQAALGCCRNECEDIAKAFQFGLAFGFGKRHDEMDKVIDEIKKVIAPQPETGYWEWLPYDYNPKLGNWRCSECRSVVIECVKKDEKGGIPLYKYCPQCGRKMQEVEE